MSARSVIGLAIRTPKSIQLARDPMFVSAEKLALQARRREAKRQQMERVAQRAAELTLSRRLPLAIPPAEMIVGHGVHRSKPWASWAYQGAIPPQSVGVPQRVSGPVLADDSPEIIIPGLGGKYFGELAPEVFERLLREAAMLPAHQLASRHQQIIPAGTLAELAHYVTKPKTAQQFTTALLRRAGVLPRDDAFDALAGHKVFMWRMRKASPLLVLDVTSLPSGAAARECLLGDPLLRQLALEWREFRRRHRDAGYVPEEYGTASDDAGPASPLAETLKKAVVQSYDARETNPLLAALDPSDQQFFRAFALGVARELRTRGVTLAVRWNSPRAHNWELGGTGEVRNLAIVGDAGLSFEPLLEPQMCVAIHAQRESGGPTIVVQDDSPI